MDSTKALNYETRPCKFVERMMILASLQRICNKFEGEYQYIGFGGVSYVDFRLFHKNLPINEMHSIEGGEYLHIDRLEFNKPFSKIKIHKQSATIALTQINIKNKNTIIWLDYDGTLCNEMFEDLKIIINKLSIGSIFIMTCNRQLKDNESRKTYTADEFRDIFGSYAPFDLANQDLSDTYSYKVISKMYNTFIDKELKNRCEETLSFHQLYNIIYQENRGARMYTFGGVVLKAGCEISEMDLCQYNFIYSLDNNLFEIKVPNITYSEEQLINKHIDFTDCYPDVLLNIVSKEDYKEYRNCYKYYPNFVNVMF